MPCYFNVVGSHQGPDSAQAVTPRFVDALAEGERSQRSRSWLADPGLSMCGCGPGHLAAIPFPGERCRAEIYNVSEGKHWSLLERLEALEELVGCRLEPRFNEPRSGGPPRGD